jgi:hypothetical protein
MISNLFISLFYLSLLFLSVAGLACIGMWIADLFRSWRVGGWEIGRDRKEIRILTRIALISLFGFSCVGGVWAIWLILWALHIVPGSD